MGCGGVSFFPFLIYIYIYNSTERRVFYHRPYFKNPIFKSFLFLKKKGKKGKPRIEFFPANKKNMRTCSIPRIEFSPANKKEKRTCSPRNVFSTECVLHGMCSL